MRPLDNKPPTLHPLYDQTFFHPNGTGPHLKIKEYAYNASVGKDAIYLFFTSGQGFADNANKLIPPQIVPAVWQNNHIYTDPNLIYSMAAISIPATDRTGKAATILLHPIIQVILLTGSQLTKITAKKLIATPKPKYHQIHVFLPKDE